jgi:ribonuclease-3
MSKLIELSTKIGYSFKDIKLLKLALTHRSADPTHNERLEFIGDGLVNLIVGEALYLRHPTEPEGELSRWRASLVQRETLAEIGAQWELEKYVLVGPGEKKTGGHERPSTLANAVEAIFGAIYFDAGFEATKAIILKTYGARLANFSIQNIQKDAKTLLQEWLQGKQYQLPKYHLLEVTGKDHNAIFKIECRLHELALSGFGEGTSKRKAEQAAAQSTLMLLKKQDHIK